MSGREPDEQAIVGYLLGTLPEEERERLEETFFRDDLAFEQALAVEDDLLHEYAQGGLSDEERRRLEERLLRTPEARERLARAQALVGALQEGSAARPWRWLPAAAAVLLAAGLGWLVYERSQPRVERAGGLPAPLPTAVPSVSTGSAPPSPALAPPPAGGIVALALAPGLVRESATPRRATLTASSAGLRLSLTLPSGPARSRYRISLLSPDGEEVWSAPGLTARGRTVTALVPAGSLPEGDYEAVLSAESAGGPEEVASYVFGILRP